MPKELITDMSKGLSADSQVHISVAFLIKAMIGISMLIATYYQVQIRFAEHENRIKELENKITVLNASVEGMETQHIEELEEQNRSLMQRLGLKR
jgi:cell division protein FtsB